MNISLVTVGLDRSSVLQGSAIRDSVLGQPTRSTICSKASWWPKPAIIIVDEYQYGGRPLGFAPADPNRKTISILRREPAIKTWPISQNGLDNPRRGNWLPSLAHHEEDKVCIVMISMVQEYPPKSIMTLG